MASLCRTTQVYKTVYLLDSKWLLNIYVIKSNSNEIITRENAISIISDYLLELEKHCISKEFTYYRTGFAFLHFGNRGVDLTFWHFGKWVTTFEAFSCSWYCYGRDLKHMELLDSAEPVICQYEFTTFIQEIKRIERIIDRIDTLSSRSFRTEFCKNDETMAS